MVGSAEGSAEGSIEGSALGCSDGVSVGSNVGSMDQEGLGLPGVGRIEGSSVGDAGEGTTVGACDAGELVGGDVARSSEGWVTVGFEFVGTPGVFTF